TAHATAPSSRHTLDGTYKSFHATTPVPEPPTLKTVANPLRQCEIIVENPDVRDHPDGEGAAGISKIRYRRQACQRQGLADDFQQELLVLVAARLALVQIGGARFRGEAGLRGGSIDPGGIAAFVAV